MLTEQFPLPPPAVCVKAEAVTAEFTVHITAAGATPQIEAYKTEVTAKQRWIVVAEANNGPYGFVIFKGRGNMPYRDIGGLIYRGQQRQLDVTSRFEPPICDPRDE